MRTWYFSCFWELCLRFKDFRKKEKRKQDLCCASGHNYRGDVICFRWVMFVEKLICDVDSRLVIHHETLKKLKRKLEIIMQMYNAPELYARAVVEVVRRKAYTDTFLRVTLSSFVLESSTSCMNIIILCNTWSRIDLERSRC